MSLLCTDARQRLERLAPALRLTATALPVVFAAGLLFSTPLLTDSRFGSDTFLVLDGAWRLHDGQRQHVDFHCAYGVFHHLLFAMGMGVFGATARAIPLVVALWSTLVFVWAYALCATRLPPLQGSFYALLVAATAMGQNQLGFPFFMHSHGAYYNRIGFVLLLVFLLALLRPAAPEQEPGARGELVFGGASAGIALALAGFTKATYAVVMLGALAALVALGRRPRAFWIALAAGAFAGTLAMGPFIGWRLDRVLVDYAAGAATRASAPSASVTLSEMLASLPARTSTELTWARVVEIGRNDFVEIMALGIVLLALRGPGPLARAGVRLAVFVAAVAASILLVLGNWQWAASPLLPALALLFARAIAELPVRRIVGWLAVGVTVPHVAAAAASLVLVPFAAWVFGGSHYRMAPLAPLLSSGYDRVGNTGRCPPALYAERVNEVAEAIAALDLPDPRIAALDFSNPYPFATQSHAPRGATVALHAQGTFLPERIEPEAIVGDANVVVAHQCPFHQPTADVLLEKVRPRLAQEFTAHELPHATVYVQRAAARRVSGPGVP